MYFLFSFLHECITHEPGKNGKRELNEGFKKLYGFNPNAHKESYCSKLEGIMHMFPGFKTEFASIKSKLDEISKSDSWWKDIRNAEVHIDIPLHTNQDTKILMRVR